MPITPESSGASALRLLLFSELAEIFPEEQLRSAISRAYFTALAKARDFAGLEHRTRDTHTIVRKHFRNKGKSKKANMRNRISKNLGFLSDLRTTADYNFSANISHHQAMKSLDLMWETLALIDQLEKMRSS